MQNTPLTWHGQTSWLWPVQMPYMHNQVQITASNAAHLPGFGVRRHEEIERSWLQLLATPAHCCGTANASYTCYPLPHHAAPPAAGHQRP